MIDMGLLDKATLKRAIKEARAWYKDPGAFQFWPEVFAAGRVTLSQECYLTQLSII